MRELMKSAHGFAKKITIGRTYRDRLSFGLIHAWKEAKKIRGIIDGFQEINNVFAAGVERHFGG